MSDIEHKEAFYIRLQLLVTRTFVESNEMPGIVAVEAECPEVAHEMKILGYTTLQPSLFRALANQGIIQGVRMGQERKLIAT